MKYQPVIGLEIHIELETNSKMFCFCKNDPDEKRANFNICPICMGHPGTLPVINKEAIRKVIKTGLAFHCQIPKESKFDRKNYFYPDLPKGYQISQYDKPLSIDGYLEIPILDENDSDNIKFKMQNAKCKITNQNLKSKKIRIRRVHLEEDTGRLVHPEGKDYSLVDFNRAGIPLMELVTEPDLNSGREARKFAEELHLIMHYLGVSDADMEKGEMRVEVNISLNQKSKISMRADGSPSHIGKNQKLGTKVEIKNLNSFRSVEKSIDYEIKRQTEILEKGDKIVQETRGWNDDRATTISQREKEEAHDYRYFPEPDLPTLHFDDEFINEIRAEIPELPQQRQQRLISEYGIDEKSAEIFVANKDLGEYFEQVVSEFEPGLKPEELKNLIKTATNYLITDLQGLLQRESVESEKFLITAENFAEFITMIQKGEISSKIAKEVLRIMFETGADPSHIIEERGLRLVSDEGEIEKAVKIVLEKNPKVVEDYKKGKQNALQFLIGQVMAETKGKAKPEIVNKILKEKID